jgi:hypothetical protein
MSKLLANQIANYGDNAPIEIKEGLSIPTGKPLQVAGTNGTPGQLLSSTGNSAQWIDSFDGNYNSLTNKPSIPSAQVQSDWNAVGTVSEILNKPVIPPQSTVSEIAASGGGSLAYTPANGQFTFAPADLSNFISSAAVANSGNWDAAYAWGDHGTVGYLTGETDTLDTVTGRGAVTTNNIEVGDLSVNGGNGIFIVDANAQIKRSNNDLRIFVAGSNNLETFANVTTMKAGSNADKTALKLTSSGAAELYYDSVKKFETTNVGVTVTGNLSVTGTTDIDIEDLNNIDLSVAPQDGQVLKYDSESSTWKPANDLVGNSQSGLGLGDLSVSVQPVGSANLSYSDVTGVFTYTPPDLTSFLTTETDPVFSASVASGIIQQNITNWNAAYGWGDHSGAGYITTEVDTLETVTGRGSSTTNPISIANNAATAFVVSDGTNEKFVVDSVDGKVNIGSAQGGDSGLYIYHQNFGTTSITLDGPTGDITTQGKIFYSNNFANLVDLPSATTYHGMFAHVHGEGHGYFAHAGAWTQLLDTGSSVNDLSDINITSPANGNILKYENGNWINTPQTGGAANVTISDTAPGLPNAGDLWWESDKGRLKVYYNDTDSSQWVDASPPLTNANVPVHVGEVELWQGGNQITWLGSNGVTAAIRDTEGGGGFQSPCIRVTFTQPFSSSDSYTIQATVYNPSQIGDVYQTSIRKTGPQHFDFQVYNLTDSVVATDFKVAITIYAI